MNITRIDQENPADELSPSQAVQAFTVIWNGARNGPGGALLFADEGPTVAAAWAPEPEKHQGKRTGSFDKVRAAISSFNGHWFSCREIADRARTDRAQTAVALHSFWKHGHLERGGDPLRYRSAR